MLSIIKMHSRIFAGLLLIGVLVVSATAFATTHAAAPTKTWNLTNPKDPITGKTIIIKGVSVSSSGTLIFNNRSVQVGGRVSASGGCGEVQFIADGANGQPFVGDIVRNVCNGTRTFGFTLPANVPGGAKDVFVETGTGGSAVNSVTVTR